MVNGLLFFFFEVSVLFDISRDNLTTNLIQVSYKKKKKKRHPSKIISLIILDSNS